MKGPLSLVPWGLQNLLGLKGEEGVFRTLEDHARLTMDLFEYLAATNCKEIITQTLSIAAEGFQTFSNFTVPNDQNWLVRGIGWVSTPGAAEAIRGKLFLLSQGTLVRQLTDYGYSNPTDAAAAGVAAGASDGAPFVLVGGDSISFNTSQLISAGLNVTVSGAILRYHS